jgi:hypothetical protein
MTRYIRNEDLTVEDVQKLVKRLGYEDVTENVKSYSPDSSYVLVVRTTDNDIQGFNSLSHARRSLETDIRNRG